MNSTLQNTDHELPDVARFIEKISTMPPDFFDRYHEIFITRAPGRLDIMGGIADYCGSMVLEMPIAEATFVALQKSSEPFIQIRSETEGNQLLYQMPLKDFRTNGKTIEYSAAREYFHADDQWAAYIAGVFCVLMREKGIRVEQGARVLISSTVPLGKGVSSSAALEASVLTAVAAAYSIKIEPKETALLCQKVENLIVGAPCGIMDQMSVVFGEENKLLSMVCQPAELNPSIVIPDEIRFWGIDSGIRHSIAGVDYHLARTGAFIGYRIIADMAGLEVYRTASMEIIDERWQGFLANISPAEFEERFKDGLPNEILGHDFLGRYGGITDKLSLVSPDETYAVQYPTAHPIYENARVRRFAELLEGKITEDVLSELGNLMFASHESYSACGLGSEGTDLIVELIKNIGIGNGLYGAKVTGGGCGGTVAVLGTSTANNTVENITREYEKLTGYKPYLFDGSSQGSASFGHIKLTLTV